MNNKNASFIVFLLLVLSGFFLGLIVGRFHGMASLGSNCRADLALDKKSYDFGFQKARERVEKNMPQLKDVYSLSGIVKEIKNNEIIFSTELLNPLQDEKLKIRKAKITDETVFSVFKMQEISKERMMEINKTIDELRNQMMVLEKEKNLEKINIIAGDMKALGDERSGYVLIEKAGISDIKPGFIIQVSALNNANLAEVESFEAAKVVAREPFKK